MKNVGNSEPRLKFDKKSLTQRWLTCGAVLVRVVSFGVTPRPPSSTEVPMRLIGLAVILAL